MVRSQSRGVQRDAKGPQGPPARKPLPFYSIVVREYGSVAPYTYARRSHKDHACTEAARAAREFRFASVCVIGADGICYWFQGGWPKEVAT